MKYILPVDRWALVPSPPARGAWIEIKQRFTGMDAILSPPARGAWIEIIVATRGVQSIGSPPARGAWIEISIIFLPPLAPSCRPPRGGRGLKSRNSGDHFGAAGVAPREGGVD